jgi:N-acetyl-gamma-glutamyl-phosphate reductase
LRVQRVAVVGASGYAGGELLRLVIAHPHLELGAAMAGTNAREAVTARHRQLEPLEGLRFEPTAADVINDHDLVFLALPHGESAALVAQVAPSVRVVDLGADFRLRSAGAWATYYGGVHAGTWTYGLPEWNRAAIATSDRVANPGCYATAIELGVLPIASHIDASDITVVAASGTSGAGRAAKANLLGSEVMGNMTPYKVGGVHQHTPEIEESIAAFAGVEARISFTPLLAPMPRGIIATITARSTLPAGEARALFADAYAESAFVRVLPEGRQPSTAATTGANTALVQVERDERLGRLIVTVALDNLVKGAAGQAIQNANLMLGLPEDSGLTTMGVAP